jgi:hypothetical protein
MSQPYETQQAPDSSLSINWQTIAHGISSGSWAVLLSLFVLYWLSKGWVSKFLDRHFELMATVKVNLAANAETMKTNAETLKVLSGTQEQLSKTLGSLDAKQDQVMATIITNHKKTTRILRALVDTRLEQVVIDDSDDEEF